MKCQRRSDSSLVLKCVKKGYAMKKKTALIIAIALIVILIAVLIVIAIIDNQKKKTLFSKSDFPVKFEQEGADMHLTIKNKTDKENLWTVSTDAYERVEVKEVTKTKKSRDEYIVSPKNAGPSIVRFIKEEDIMGVKFNVCTLSISFSVEEEKDGLIAKLYPSTSSIRVGDRNVFAKGTDYPFYIESDTYGSSIVFLNGVSDWEISIPSGDPIISNLAVQNERDAFTFEYDDTNLRDELLKKMNVSADPREKILEDTVNGVAKAIFGVDSIEDVSADAMAKLNEALLNALAETDKKSDAKKTEETKAFTYKDYEERMSSSSEASIYDSKIAPDEPIVNEYIISSKYLDLEYKLEFTIDTNGRILISRTSKSSKSDKKSEQSKKDATSEASSEAKNTSSNDAKDQE
ncbi:MAG: hypothetical protein K5656_01530 [Lachnospiraceae bacterium]|nr:hypothetical protein [Lachnospiraceae bacterium]